MLANCEMTTKKGHRIDVSCWKSSSKLNYAIHINGCGPITGTADDDFGRSTPESEARLQALLTLSDIEDGALRWIEGEWRCVTAEEMDRGNALWGALCATARDTWRDGGVPERVTEGSEWDFDGWNSVRNHMAVYDWVILGGDLYAKEVA